MTKKFTYKLIDKVNVSRARYLWGLLKMVLQMRSFILIIVDTPAEIEQEYYAIRNYVSKDEARRHLNNMSHIYSMEVNSEQMLEQAKQIIQNAN